jgi:glycosyltransferase involved in cell wall biosynthesis
MTRVLREPPTVGIVTPTLNAARWLPEAIDSVLSQDYPHVDYLVMDGGSTDGTRELLESHGDRLRWVSARDRGQADAVTRGWSRVSGQILAFLNADDAYLPGAVAAAARALQDPRGTGAVYGDGELVDERGRSLGRYPTAGPGLEDFAGACPICQPAAFVTREAVEAAGGLDTRLHYAFDYDLWIRLAARAGLRRIDRPLARVLMRGDSKTLGRRRAAYREAIEVAKRRLGYVSLGWLDAYAMHRVSGTDGLFAPHVRSVRSLLLALGLGLRHNPRQARRFWREWSVAGGLRADHTERWPDGWISRLHVSEHAVPEGASVLRLRGRHEAHLAGPLRLTVRAGGAPAARVELPERGPFELAVPVPAELGGRTVRVAIEADRTWSPRRDGDFRRVSCLVDAIVLE